MIPGAGGQAWTWYRVVAELERLGHRAIAVDLPAEDATAGLATYADTVIRAAGSLHGVCLAAASLGAFTAPLVLGPLQPVAVVLLNAMIPVPGETPGEWWSHVGAEEARVEAALQHGYPAELDPQTYFLHDVPPDVLADAPAPRVQSDGPFSDPCEFDEWPVGVTVLAGEDDRFFPPSLQRRLARERLKREAVMVPGGHLAALSHPAEVAQAMVATL